MNPMTTLARENVDRRVKLLLRGGQSLSGTLVRVADDGLAVRLQTSDFDDQGGTFVATDAIDAMQVFTR